MEVKPLNNNIVVKAEEVEEKTKSGIWKPDSAKDDPQVAVVIAVGPGKINDITGQRTTINVKAGEKIVHYKNAGTEFKFEEEKLLILQEDQILGVIR